MHDHDYALLIGGDRVGGLDAATRAVIDPATGETIAEVPEGGPRDADRAVAAARAAAPAWARTPPGERAQALLDLADAIDLNAEEFAALETLDVGKPSSVSADEPGLSTDALRFFAGAGRVPEGRSVGEYVADHTSMIRREPLGVVAAITPWNYPLMMACWKLGAALAAGNTLVLKPSEEAPLSTLRLAELAAGLFPPGVFNVVQGTGSEVGAALVRHPGVDMVSLTGDVATGVQVVRDGAQTMKRMHLELGGKAPVIVLDDADLEAVVDAVRMAGFTNSGQDCTAATRVIATAAVHDELRERLAVAIGEIAMGAPADAATEMGPVISARQQHRVRGFIDRAAASGAEIVVGGSEHDGPGAFVAPTLIAVADQAAEIVQREIFGPVVTIQRAAGEDEAVDWANDSAYGLASSVWTERLATALDVSRRLDFGTVWINDHMMFANEMPHGGYGQSGNGCNLSAYALEEHTRIKHVMARIA
jgi:1-pyrroline dehydrogenase